MVSLDISFFLRTCRHKLLRLNWTSRCSKGNRGKDDYEDWLGLGFRDYRG